MKVLGGFLKMCSFREQRNSSFIFFFFRNCFQESSSYPKFTVKDFNLKTWYGITYMRNLKRNETNELTKQKET